MFNDCRGNAHDTNQERHDADVTIVEEILSNVSECVNDYTTGNSDYGDGYYHIVDELASNWAKDAEDYVRSAFERCDDYDDNSDVSDTIVEDVCSTLQGSFDSEPEYNPGEYAVYSGPGLCLAQFPIGEYEEQVEIGGFKELQALHDASILDDILDDVNCSCYVLRQCRRKKNEKTGVYEDVGRETYGANRDQPYLMTYHHPGGQWIWVIPKERIDDLIQDAIGDIA